MNLLFNLEPEEFAKLRPASRPSLVERRYHGVLYHGERVVWVCDSFARPCFHLNPSTAMGCAAAEVRRRQRMFKRWQQLRAAQGGPR